MASNGCYQEAVRDLLELEPSCATSSDDSEDDDGKGKGGLCSDKGGGRNTGVPHKGKCGHGSKGVGGGPKDSGFMGGTGSGFHGCPKGSGCTYSGFKGGTGCEKGADKGSTFFGPKGSFRGSYGSSSSSSGPVDQGSGFGFHKGSDQGTAVRSSPYRVPSTPPRSIVTPSTAASRSALDVIAEEDE